MASYLSRPSSSQYWFNIPTREWEKRRRGEIPGTTQHPIDEFPESRLPVEGAIEALGEDVQALGKADAAELSRIALLGDVKGRKNYKRLGIQPIALAQYFLQ